MLKVLALVAPVLAIVLLVTLHRLEVWVQRDTGPSGAGPRSRRRQRRARTHDRRGGSVDE